MRVAYRAFGSSTQSWETLFAEVAAFATDVGREHLIGISHSHGGTDLFGEGVVTVWYWTDRAVD